MGKSKASKQAKRPPPSVSSSSSEDEGVSGDVNVCFGCWQVKPISEFKPTQAALPPGRARCRNCCKGLKTPVPVYGSAFPLTTPSERDVGAAPSSVASQPTFSTYAPASDPSFQQSYSIPSAEAQQYAATYAPATSHNPSDPYAHTPSYLPSPYGDDNQDPAAAYQRSYDPALAQYMMGVAMGGASSVGASYGAQSTYPPTSADPRSHAAVALSSESSEIAQRGGAGTATAAYSSADGATASGSRGGGSSVSYWSTCGGAMPPAPTVTSIVTALGAPSGAPHGGHRRAQQAACPPQIPGPVVRMLPDVVDFLTIVADTTGASGWTRAQLAARAGELIDLMSGTTTEGPPSDMPYSTFAKDIGGRMGVNRTAPPVAADATDGVAGTAAGAAGVVMNVQAASGGVACEYERLQKLPLPHPSSYTRVPLPRTLTIADVKRSLSVSTPPQPNGLVPVKPPASHAAQEALALENVWREGAEGVAGGVAAAVDGGVAGRLCIESDGAVDSPVVSTSDRPSCDAVWVLDAQAALGAATAVAVRASVGSSAPKGETVAASAAPVVAFMHGPAAGPALTALSAWLEKAEKVGDVSASDVSAYTSLAQAAARAAVSRSGALADIPKPSSAAAGGGDDVVGEFYAAATKTVTLSSAGLAESIVESFPPAVQSCITQWVAARVAAAGFGGGDVGTLGRLLYSLLVPEEGLFVGCPLAPALVVGLGADGSVVHCAVVDNGIGVDMPDDDEVCALDADGNPQVAAVGEHVVKGVAVWAVVSATRSRNVQSGAVRPSCALTSHLWRVAGGSFMRPCAVVAAPVMCTPWSRMASLLVLPTLADAAAVADVNGCVCVPFGVRTTATVASEFPEGGVVLQQWLADPERGVDLTGKSPVSVRVATVGDGLLNTLGAATYTLGKGDRSFVEGTAAVGTVAKRSEMYDDDLIIRLRLPLAHLNEGAVGSLVLVDDVVFVAGGSAQRVPVCTFLPLASPALNDTPWSAPAGDSVLLVTLQVRAPAVRYLSERDMEAWYNFPGRDPHRRTWLHPLC